MPCEHLKQLYALCNEHELQLSSSDVIRIVCPHCQVEETCPSVHLAEYESRRAPAGEGDSGSTGD